MPNLEPPALSPVRRRALFVLALAFATLPTSRSLVAQDDPVPTATATAEAEDVVLGSGTHRYRWIGDWAERPDDKDYGNTHGCVAVDAAGRILFNTDTKNAVLIHDASGKRLGAWGKEFHGGLHGMTIRTEQVLEDGKQIERQFLYLAHTGRHEVCKTTLDGEVLWTIGYPKESGIYEDESKYRPTGIAVGPNGAIYVADGYGASWVHQFDADRKWVRSWGGRGTEPGKMRTPHGIWLDTRAETPVLIVADRENHRLQVFDLDGKLLSVVEQGLRRPCNVYQHGTELVVADLTGRITLLDAKNELIAHLGEQSDPGLRAKNNVPRDKWRDGEFISPHSAAFDADGNIYVMDWVRAGRVTKLERIRD